MEERTFENGHTVRVGKEYTVIGHNWPLNLPTEARIEVTSVGATFEFEAVHFPERMGPFNESEVNSPLRLDSHALKSLLDDGRLRATE